LAGTFDRRVIVDVVLPIDLIALDLDGTLLDANDDISSQNRDALRAALAAGVRVVLVTGRGADLPARLVRELKLNVPAICAHGALTKDFLSGRTLGHIPVPLLHALPMIHHAERLRLDVAVYFEERFLRLEGTAMHMEDMRGPHWREVGSLIDVVKTPPTFVRFMGRDSVEAMRGAFAELPLHFKYEVWGEFEECAVTSLEATKENALARLCADLKIPSSRVLAIGDSRNDVPMLRWAGIGVAMGNAPSDVRQAVGRVTAPCDADGVARAIERYVLEPAETKERSA
jgi:hydroxymethylpyrimidine pyrophosphatase-like HAD family hydrolase